jgi:hypothetical protein
MMKKLIIILLICLVSNFFQINCYASSIFSKTSKFIVKEIIINQKKKRAKLQKEVCKIFKDKIIQKKIKFEDLDLISELIHDRIPFGKWKPLKKYKNITEQVGFELIDKRLTITDYEIIKEWLNNIWKMHYYIYIYKYKNIFYYQVLIGGNNIVH